MQYRVIGVLRSWPEVPAFGVISEVSGPRYGSRITHVVQVWTQDAGKPNGIEIYREVGIEQLDSLDPTVLECIIPERECTASEYLCPAAIADMLGWTGRRTAEGARHVEQH